MKTTIGHIQIHLPNFKEEMPFYKGFLNYLGLHVIMEHETMIGFGDANNTSIWFSQTPDEHKDYKYNRDANGLNHIGFNVDSKEDVDKFVEEYMKPNNIEPKWNTPRLRTDFTGDKGVYYQVMFEGPDGLAIEVVYTKW